jgi:diadenosine tetraphosphate (Ap4A) HIT family hydrolase
MHHPGQAAMHHHDQPHRYSLHAQLDADTLPITSFALSDVRLMDDANYPWLVLVPRVADASELTDLDAAQRHLLSDEIDRAARALREGFRPFKLNIAALGNLVPQLHVHVIARQQSDPAWPLPVWGRVAAKPHTPELLVERIALLQALLRN